MNVECTLTIVNQIIDKQCYNEIIPFDKVYFFISVERLLLVQGKRESAPVCIHLLNE